MQFNSEMNILCNVLDIDLPLCRHCNNNDKVVIIYKSFSLSLSLFGIHHLFSESL
jgi:hypothetical protein